MRARDCALGCGSLAHGAGDICHRCTSLVSIHQAKRTAVLEEKRKEDIERMIFKKLHQGGLQ